MNLIGKRVRGIIIFNQLEDIFIFKIILKFINLEIGLYLKLILVYFYLLKCLSDGNLGWE